MIAKHEHNVAQQKAMLESVRSQLAEVRDTVGSEGFGVGNEGAANQFCCAASPATARAPLPWRLMVSCLPLAVRRIFCRLILHVQFILSMILILTWRMRLNLSSQKQTKRKYL